MTGMTLFSTLCKICEMILLNRLDNSEAHKGIFSEMQFGFQERVGCTEASFTILETINHMLERSSKVFRCFLDVCKASNTVWIDGILYKLFSELGILYKLFPELGIEDRMWKVMKDLYTNVEARLLYAGSLSRKINVLQGTEQCRILAPFMYKVCINGILCVLTNHCYAIFINGLRIPSFLKTFMSICYKYGIKWRHGFNHSKSGIVTFGESKP